MSITANGSGKITYSEPQNKRRSDATGTVVDNEFSIIDNTNVLKQIRFNVNPTTAAAGVLTLQCDVAGDSTINLTGLVSGNSFGIVQPDTGTSPTATSAADTLTLTSSNSSIGISGNSATKTIDLTLVGSTGITTLTGDVTAGPGSGGQVATIANSAITNAKIIAAAGISVNKLAALTSGRAVVSDASGFISAATTTSTEIGYVNGVTSAIQTQLNAVRPYNFFLYGDQFDSPNTSDWTVNSLASAGADATNTALTTRSFDDTTEEGVGFTIHVPTFATNIKLYFTYRAQTAPGAIRAVGSKLYYRSVPNNSSISSWSSKVLADKAIPTSALFQYTNETVALSSFSPAISAGSVYQFEITRVAPGAGTNLTGDWNLLELIVEFT